MYQLLPDLVIRLVFEIVLRQGALELSQPRQYIFYSFLAIEYAYAASRLPRLRFVLSALSGAALLVLVMIAQGVIVGLFWDNAKSRMIIDTINIVVIFLNLLLLSENDAFKNFNINKLSLIAYIFSFTMIFLALVTTAINPASQINLGSAASQATALSIIVAALICSPTASVINPRLLLTAAVFAGTAQSWNRTTLLFVGVAFSLYFARRARSSPFQAAFLILLCGSMTFVGASALPPESALARRLQGVEDIDLSARDGSIGERQSEADAVSEKLRLAGSAAVLFGGGHGATYNVKYTWNWKENYANAHYSWVLFQLRYGDIGLIYLVLWSFLLIPPIIRSLRYGRPEFVIIGLLAIWNLGYLITYSYFSFFIAGLQFANPKREE